MTKKATILSEVDKAALELAMKIARQEPGRAEQLDAKLKTESWFNVATFASYCCQTDSLNLRPWQEPTCHVYFDEPVKTDDVQGRCSALQLLAQMEALGISRWHPDPLAAIAEAEQQKVEP
jgi:hypothetical protein